MSSFEKYYYEQVGAKIRKYRISLGLTQERLSEILGLNSKYIGHVERCERKVSTKVLIKIIDFFQIQPEEFFSFTPNYIWDKK